MVFALVLEHQRRLTSLRSPGARGSTRLLLSASERCSNIPYIGRFPAPCSPCFGPRLSSKRRRSSCTAGRQKSWSRLFALRRPCGAWRRETDRGQCLYPAVHVVREAQSRSLMRGDKGQMKTPANLEFRAIELVRPRVQQHFEIVERLGQTLVPVVREIIYRADAGRCLQSSRWMAVSFKPAKANRLSTKTAPSRSPMPPSGTGGGVGLLNNGYALRPKRRLSATRVGLRVKTTDRASRGRQQRLRDTRANSPLAAKMGLRDRGRPKQQGEKVRMAPLIMIRTLIKIRPSGPSSSVHESINFHG